MCFAFSSALYNFFLLLDEAYEENHEFITTLAEAFLFFRQELKAESARREEEFRLRDDDWRSALQRVAEEVDAKSAQRAAESKKESQSPKNVRTS